MAAVIMDGKKLAEELNFCQAERVEKLLKKGKKVTLAVILAGDSPASKTYVRNKQISCQKLGIESRNVMLPESVSQEELEKEITVLCSDENVDGVLVQLPLPQGLDGKRALQCIPPEKDVDGFHPINQGKLLAGEETVLPCTPAGIIYMLKKYGVPLAGKHAVVLGRSGIVGKPAALLLLQENCTVTICHSKTENLSEITRQADILVSAVGKARFVTKDMVKPGAAVVDVGINRENGKLCGDVDFENVQETAGFISPVPGGTGKMTVAMLMENVIRAAEKRFEQ